MTHAITESIRTRLGRSLGRSLGRLASGRRSPRASVVVVLDGDPTTARRTLASVVQATAATPGVEVVAVSTTAQLSAMVPDDLTSLSATDLTSARTVGIGAARGERVLVLVPGLELVPGGLETLLAEPDPVVIGELLDTPGGPLRPALLGRMLIERSACQVLPSDDRDGTRTAVALAGSASYVYAPIVRDVRPGEERSLFRESPWTTAEDYLAAFDSVVPEMDFDEGWLSRTGRLLLERVEDADQEQWERFLAVVGPRITPVVLAAMDLEPRALVWTAIEQGREALTELVAERRHTDGFVTSVVGGAVVGRLPPLPAELSPLRGDESSLRARLTRVGPDELELQAGICHVDHTDPSSLTARVQLFGVPLPTTVHSDPAVTRWMGEREQSHDAGRVIVSLPEGGLPDDAELRLTLETSGIARSGLVVERDDHGSASLRPAPERGVRSVEVDGLEVRVEADVSGPAVLTGPEVALVGAGEGPWVFSLSADVWSGGERPAPSGGYRFEVGGEPVPVAAELLARLPLEQRTTDHRVHLRRGPGGALVVRLDPPLDDDEAGRYQQARLQREYLSVREPLNPRLVYVQSFTGRHVNDHPAAIQAELHRQRPDLDVRWAVADSGSAVPPGARPVLMRSREWYDVLARAGHVVTNVDLERWFRRREGQQVLQTYHGYPSKRMGLDQWRARGFPPSQIAQDLARSSGTWTALLTPQPDANVYYREQYAYDGRILDVGYPRDDVLVRPGDRREAVRSLLAVGSRKVLLYAPTWRDDLATDFRAASAEHHLDFGLLADRLGPEWLVLLRGHRFHGAGPSSAALLDVTGYPEVNDLILAADAAVLDYSSLRFDFALTGRPAVYLVPDLDDYTGRVRGFLQDYRDTAPGPLVTSTAEVASELDDLPGLTTRWAPDIGAFNARYQSLADGHASERVVAAFFADLPAVDSAPSG